MNRTGTRRNNGEGSVFQVSENKWVAKISMGRKPDGKPNVKQFSGKTEAVVRRKLRDFKKSEDFAQKHIPRNDTVQDYFATWLREYQYNKLKPSSYDRLECTAINQIYPNIGGMKMGSVTRDQIQALLNRLYKKDGLSYSSVKKVYVALNACYRTGIKNKACDAHNMHRPFEQPNKAVGFGSPLSLCNKRFKSKT